MNKAEYNYLLSNQSFIRVTELSNTAMNDRTLVYGYTLDRSTFHLYLQNGQIKMSLSNGDSTLYENFGDEIQTHKAFPDKRVYPEKSDMEFCKLIMDKGYTVPFTSFDENFKYNPFTYYGKIL